MQADRCGCEPLTASASTATAACARDDLGPFPCIEAGCPEEAPLVGCRYLAAGGVCELPVTEVWERPLAWLAADGAHVWQACPHACGLCPQEPRRRHDHDHDPLSGGGALGSCDA